MAFKDKWNYFWCNHHWHKEPGSERKVPHKYNLKCKKFTEEENRYITKDSSFGILLIQYATLNKCCKCNKREIVIHETFATDKTINHIMKYPDLKENSLHK